MIGTLLSMKFIGKKSWKDSAIFWAVIFVIGIILSFIVSGVLIASLIGSIPTNGAEPDMSAMTGLVVGAFVLIILLALVRAVIIILLAKFWYKFPWIEAIKIWAVAFVIDIIISYILSGFGIFM